MTTLDVRDQLVEEIALVGGTIGATIPEVMMGITDGNLRLQGRFLSQGQPVIASVWHKAPPLQDGAAHAAHTAAGHQW